MSRKKIALAAVLCVLAVLCGVGIRFAPYIRDAVSVIQNASLDEETRAAQEEETRRKDEEVRDRFDVPQGEVDASINAGVLDGSLSLEEAAAQWLEENGLPGGGEETPSGTGGTASGGGDSGSVGGEADPVSPPQDSEQPAPPPQPEQPEPPAQTEPPKQTEQSEPPKQTEQPEPPKQTEQPEPPKQTEQPEPPKQTEQPKQPEQSDPPKQTEQAENTEQAERERKIQNLIAQAYVLRSVFTARLDGLIAQCKTEFLSLPAEQQTTANKIGIVTSHLGEVAAMEEECDAQVAEIVRQLEELDPETAAEVQNQYEQEKLAKKTSLLEEYRNGSN